MKVELLYFDGCPYWQQGLENLKAALAAEGLTAEIRLVKVESEAQAARLKFLGSPSFRLNGEDLWSEEHQAYHLSCRVYRTPEGIKGAPSVPMLREKLRAR